MTTTSNDNHGAPPQMLLQARLNLWEADTCALLEQAHELAVSSQQSQQEEAEFGNNRVPVLPSTRMARPDNKSDDDSSSSEEDDGNERGVETADDDVSDSSEESENDEESNDVESESDDDAPLTTATTAPLETVQEGKEEDESFSEQHLHPKSSTATATRKHKQPPPPSNKQQKRQLQLVKQHASNLQRIQLQLPPDAAVIEGGITTTTDDDNSTYLICPPAALLPKQQPTTATTHCMLQLSQQLSSSSSSSSQHNNNNPKPVVILLLQSGRFAGGVFVNGECVAHRTLSQYTVRKGQGKAQSSMDSSRRPKSVGSQLRRAGEQALQQDIRGTLQEWSNKEYIQNAALLLVACPKTMRSVLFGDKNDEVSKQHFLLKKDDARLCKIPFDVGRPTYESVKVVHAVMMGVDVVAVRRTNDARMTTEMIDDANNKNNMEDDLAQAEEMLGIAGNSYNNKAPIKEEERKPAAVDLPLTPLHHACKDGNLQALLEILRDMEPGCVDIGQPAGYDCMTPLHFAAASTESTDPINAAACVSALFIQGHATPSIVDARDRPPYFLATHDRVREAFRKARAVLGEDFCDWEAAKVGSALTEEDVAAKKEKEAEKKRRKKARQKANKAKEKAQAQEMEERRKAEEEERQQAQEAKRVRDGLNGTPTGPNVCDYCQKVVKGKKRNQMFQRLEYKYCSSDCVNAHKRELMANAAAARFGS